MGQVDDNKESNSSKKDEATIAKKATKPKQRAMSKGAWRPEEDHILAETIAIRGAKKWSKIAALAGLNRCGKSCRLRWMNYLRPNIKRGDISAQEEDLILRLHKLLGNRWALIAGRLPGRTDNEIKNYWNSHLSKRMRDANGQDPERRSRSTNVKNYEDSQGPSSSIARSNVKVNHHTNPSIIAQEADQPHTKLLIENNKNEMMANSFGASEFEFLSEGFFELDWISSFLEFDGCS
uniref:Uncharacterized protein n=1 Tax=Kalanchoe fedtschenkoi TaxID=63787 RepID=A0A7N0SX23_KALFE